MVKQRSQIWFITILISIIVGLHRQSKVIFISFSAQSEKMILVQLFSYLQYVRVIHHSAAWPKHGWRSLKQHICDQYTPTRRQVKHTGDGIYMCNISFNSSPHCAAYIRQWIGSALVQIKARRLFDAKPLFEPLLGYCQFDSSEQISVTFKVESYHFHSRKCIWKCQS